MYLCGRSKHARKLNLIKILLICAYLASFSSERMETLKMHFRSANCTVWRACCLLVHVDPTTKVDPRHLDFG